MSDDADRVRKERDLYQHCLRLAQSDDPEPMLSHAVRLLRDVAGAERGYIELCEASTAHPRAWSADIGVGEDDRQRIRARISGGIIAEAIESGETLHVPDALLDARFGERASVRNNAINAVLCVPLCGEGITGVVYLQNRIEGEPVFDGEDVRCVEVVAGFVSSLAGRLLELMRRRSQADATSDIRERLQLEGVVGRSAALANLLARLEVVASMSGNVLFVGPSGTGKSMLAKVLHDNSPRADGPFVEVNCAALPEALIESELFGAERGAHSAVAQRGIDGKVAAAEGGTLFLDEIGELKPDLQGKLLQLLQSKQYYRLGGSKPIVADVRIVAATNRDLERLIADGRFREDLYYRLRGVQLRMPPLEERREDVPLLARRFVADACQRNGLPEMQQSYAALAALEFADWPGNVRQLANRCEEAVVGARIEGAQTIEVRHLFPAEAQADDDGVPTFQQHRDIRDRDFLSRALADADWNVAQTARTLEMSRSHLNALIRRFGLRRAQN